MTDSSGSEGGQEQQPVEQNGTAQQEPPPVNGQVAVGEPEPGQEEERTLTDHLNKKLLESFLERLDSGNM